MAENNDLQEDLETVPEVFVPPDAAEAPAGGVTRARLDELNADPSLLDTAEDYEAVKPYLVGGKEWPEADVITETAEEAAEREANEAAAAAAAAPAVPETPTAAAPDLDIEQVQGEVEAIAALRTTTTAERVRLDAIIKAPAPEDKFSDEYDAWRTARDNAMEEKMALSDKFQDELATISTRTREQTLAARRGEQLFQQFDAVSARHPEVKLAVPFKKANDEYAGWLNRLVTAAGITDGTPAEKHAAAVAKFEADPAFAATVPAPKDLAKIKILLEAHGLVRAADGKRSLEGAVAEVLDRQGVFSAREQAARTAGGRSAADKTQEALRRAAGAPVTAPLSGGSKAPQVLAAPTDAESASKYLTNLLDKQGKGIALTPFETKFEVQAKRLIGLPPVASAMAR